MLLKNISFASPEENILYDEVLFNLAEKNPAGSSAGVLRFWESTTPFIVLGKIGNPSEDIRGDVVSREGIPVLRRSSGGGTVLQGPGCLNYTAVLSKEIHPDLGDLRRSYQFIFEKIMAALATPGIEAEYRPISDLVLPFSNKKFSGNAQHRGRRFILHHGTFLYQFDLKKVERYLKIPQDMPEYRQGRGHAEFITNIIASPEKIKSSLRKVFEAEQEEETLNTGETEALRSLLSTRSVKVDLKNF